MVDDGSRDGSAALVEAWAQSAPFPVRLFRQANGGKHSAWNRAVAACRSPYFLVFDSDDACVPEALAGFRQAWESLGARASEFSHVACLCEDQFGTLVGTPFPADRWEADHLQAFWLAGVRGDKWECYRTEALRTVPFFDPGRRTVVPEGWLLARLARRWRALYLNVRWRIYWNDGPDTSLVRARDPRRAAWGQFLVEGATLNDYPDWYARVPRVFIIAALKWGRTARLSRLGLTAALTYLTRARARLWALAFWVPGRLIASLERLMNRSASGLL